MQYTDEAITATLDAAFDISDAFLELAKQAEQRAEALQVELDNTITKQASATPEDNTELYKEAADALCESSLLASTNKEDFVAQLQEGGVKALVATLQKVASTYASVEKTNQSGYYVPRTEQSDNEPEDEWAACL